MNNYLDLTLQIKIKRVDKLLIKFFFSSCKDEHLVYKDINAIKFSLENKKLKTFFSYYNQLASSL